MELISYAKINIGLTIKKYSSQYKKHKLESLFLLIDDYYDYIFIDKIENDKTKITYYFQDKLINLENDLVIKTLNYFRTNFNIKDNFNIVIKKHIPIGAGLGGSSSNAGTIISYLIKTYNLELLVNDWLNIAISLGSDIPFFASGYKMALVSGYGHKLCMIDKPFPKYLIFSNDLKCSTTQVYQTYDKSKKCFKFKTNFWSIIESLPNINNHRIINDLQTSAFVVNPELLNIFRSYDASRKIFLTGSGSFFVELF